MEVSPFASRPAMMTVLFRSLDLGAGHRACAAGSVQGRAVDRSGQVVAAQTNPSAHAAQESGDSVHGTAAQVRVPGQASREGLAGQKAHEQASRGPGTAGVQNAAGLEEAAPAPSRDPDGRAAAAEPHAQAF